MTWPPSLRPLPPPPGCDPRGRDKGRSRTTSQNLSLAEPENPRKGLLPGGLDRGQSSGRARDVVRGQDGHDDGSNMMRVPSRRLSAPMDRVSRGRVAVPGHNLQPWAPRERSCSVLLSSRYSLDPPPTPPAKVSSLVKTFGTCRRREGKQNLAMGRHAWHANRACNWWAEAGVCPSWAPLHAGLKKAGSEAILACSLRSQKTKPPSYRMLAFGNFSILSTARWVLEPFLQVQQAERPRGRLGFPGPTQGEG